MVAAAVLLSGLNMAEAGPPPFKKKQPPPKAKAKPHKPVPKPQPTRYGGKAVAVNLTNAANGSVWRLAGTGPVLNCGGAITVSNGPTSIDNLLSVEGAVSSISAVGGVTVSSSEVLNFSAVFIHNGITNVIAFSYAAAEARAECTSNGAVISATSQVQGLTIDGTSVVVTGETNQVIAIDGGALVLNAQMGSVSGNRKNGEVTVAAIYLMLSNSFNGPIAFARAVIHCGSGVPPGMRTCDKVTGGGFIIGTPPGTNGLPGARGSFSVGGGTKRGQLWGYLGYTDHGTGMRVNATAVTGFTVIDIVTRQIDYDVLIDGVPGTARVLVADNGEPGRNDIFDITLSTGYHAGGDLGGPGPGGGNIQQHKCPPGWAR